MQEKDLEERVEDTPSNLKIYAVDTASNVTFSLAVGTLMDCLAGLTFTQVIASRSMMTGLNLGIGGPYGWYREKVFDLTRTKEDSSKFRKYISDLIAGETFMIPLYTSVIALATYVSEGEVNMEKVEAGARNIMIGLPFISPAFNYYIDRFRRWFGIKPGVERAYKKDI